MLYEEIKDVVAQVDAIKCLTKKSKEKTMKGKKLYSPKALNKEFERLFNQRGWAESRYRYYVTTNRQYMEEMIRLPLKEQKIYLIEHGVNEPIQSYKQTDLLKNQVAVEVQFGKYAFVAFDLFVKHLLFFSGGVINVGVEILPMKEMAKDPKGGRLLSTGIAYFEGEVYNILRHGRSSPPVPLLLIGIAP
jgi:hypothetical protein